MKKIMTSALHRKGLINQTKIEELEEFFRNYNEN